MCTLAWAKILKILEKEKRDTDSDIDFYYGFLVRFLVCNFYKVSTFYFLRSLADVLLLFCVSLLLLLLLLLLLRPFFLKLVMRPERGQNSKQ